jgi:hypothetical protein
VAIADEQTDAVLLRSNFEIEDFINFHQYDTNEHMMVQKFFMKGMYRSKRRTFLKEIMLKLNKSCVYLKCLPDQKMPAVASDMFPVRPRRQ